MRRGPKLRGMGYKMVFCSFAWFKGGKKNRNYDGGCSSLKKP